MESITLELAVSEFDARDRTLSLLVRNEQGLVLHRAWRVADDIRSSDLAFYVGDILYQWLVPQPADSASFSDRMDAVEHDIAATF